MGVELASQMLWSPYPDGLDLTVPGEHVAELTPRTSYNICAKTLFIHMDKYMVLHDLLRQYVGERDVVVFAFGERELRPYPPSPPQWLPNAQRQQTNAWGAVLPRTGALNDHERSHPTSRTKYERTE